MAKKKGFVLGCTALLSLLSIVGCAPTDSSSSSSSASSSSSTKVVPQNAANGAYNYVASSYDERAKITGILEEYALKNHLTGLTLYGDGGYSLASSRLKYPYSDYLTGYGFGLARYGSIDASDSKFQIVDDDTTISGVNEFYHGYDSTPITTLNALDSDGSQVSDYWSYFESSLFGERIKNDDTSASNLTTEWYPILAKTMPVAVNKNESTGLASKWRFQLRTGASDGIKYKTESDKRTKWNNVDVKAEDYVYALKVLLTKKVGYYRASQYTSGDATIVGASAYYAASSDGMDTEKANEAWKGVGFKLVNEDGSEWSGDQDKAFIEIEYVTPCNEFNSYYRLSDALIAPINADFYAEVCGTGEDFKPENYANQSEDKSTTAADNVLSVGAYTLKRINGANNGDIVFVRNADWYETTANDKLYQIKGYKFRFDTNLNQDALASINHFKAKECDSASIPSSVWDEFSSDSGDYWVKKLSGNSSTYKMNVNGCTQERWEQLFGETGSIATTSKSDYWNVKPIMSNSDFLDGVWFSTNRTAIADSMHKNRASDYFSEAYMADPETGVSYNSTSYHKAAAEAYSTTDAAGNNTYGFDLATAKTYFGRAAKALTDAGTYKAGDKITLYTYYQAQSQINQWGNTWAQTIVEAFNEAAKPYGLTLEIKNEAVDVWYNVYYTKMMVGQFDFAFGSISGNTLNPLNFLEVLKSDNSSGFTLNWGVDTSEVSSDLVYDGKAWSFDALFNVANSGGMVKDGEMAIPYVYNEKKSVVSDDGEVSVVFDYDADVVKAANIDLTSLVIGLNLTVIGDDGSISTYYDTSAGDLYVGGEIDEDAHTITATITPADICAYYGLKETSDEYATYFAQFKAFLLSAKGAHVSLACKFTQNVEINGISGQYTVPLTASSTSFGVSK